MIHSATRDSSKTMKSIQRIFKPIPALLLCMFLTGCSGYQTCAPSSFSNWPHTFQNNDTPIEQGETVKVQLHDGQILEGTVESMNASGFVLTGQQIDPASVEQGQVQKVLWVPTVVLGVASVFTIFVLTAPAGTFSTD